MPYDIVIKNGRPGLDAIYGLFLPPPPRALSRRLIA